MSLLDRILPTPRLVEVDHVDLAIAPDAAWALVRHLDLGERSAAARALFAIRTLPFRLAGSNYDAPRLRIDDIRSSAEEPGFQILAEDPQHEIAIGAIGKVWQLDIPFVHVNDAAAFAAFSDEGFVKVAWSLRVLPHGEGHTRVECEVRVDATDDAAWSKFRAYFRIIGPASRFIRRTLLSSLAREPGAPESSKSREDAMPLPGDELLSDARAQLTHGITIEATPEKIWPWLVQMGCDRAGYYSIDLLDNGGRRSAREVHPELQDLRVGQVLPATPGSRDGFEVLAIDPGRSLVLGGLWYPDEGQQLPFHAIRPTHHWHVTWSFTLEPLDPKSTRLHVRARAAYPDSGSMRASFMGPVHTLMETAQLHGLKARVEGTLPRDDAHDVVEGLGGACRMLLALLTPFRRSARAHWGLDLPTASRVLPGDELVPTPRWSWTHGIEIDASAEDVWKWIAQIGTDRGGFYSYQWLENVAGCELRNTETIHPEWELKRGDGLRLHPKMDPLEIVAMERGRWFVAFAPAPKSKQWVSASWLFYVEPLGKGRTRLISRYRAASSDDLATRLSFGPALVEPIGFAMDRRMLLGVKERAERGAQHVG